MAPHATKRPHRKSHPASNLIRLGQIVFIAVYCAVPWFTQCMDDGLAVVYKYFMATSFAHWDMSEAIVAASSFVIWAFLFTNCWVFGWTKTNGMKAVSEVNKDVPFLYASNGISYLGAVWLYLTYLRTKPPPPVEACSFGRFMIELAFGIWAYDFCFYWLHLGFHKCGRLKTFRWIGKLHVTHHDMGGQASRSLEASDTFRQHFLDGTAQVIVNVFVQQISPFGGGKHFISKLVHNIVVTYMLCEAHSGYDLPWMTHRVWPEVFGGSPRHEVHHHNGNVYFHQFFMYLDNFFGYVDQKDNQAQHHSQRATKLKVEKVC